MTVSSTIPAAASGPYTALFGGEPDTIGELPIAVHVVGSNASEAVDASHAALRAYFATRADTPAKVLARQTKSWEDPELGPDGRWQR